MGAIASLVSLGALASAAAAELVQHTYTGVVAIVTDGSAGTIDLTGTFSNGQNVTIATTLERSTPGFPSKTGETVYLNAITALSFTIGSYTGTLGPSSFSSIIVANDLAVAPREPVSHPAGAVLDYYVLQVSNPNSAAIGPAIPTSLEIDLFDDEATQFSDSQLPRTMPALADFETADWRLFFLDSGATTVGIVAGTLGSVSTPASPSTWGRIKAGYRN